jgi:hypothetical protein
MSTPSIENRLFAADRDALIRMIATEKPTPQRVREWLKEHGVDVKLRSVYDVRKRHWKDGPTPDSRRFLLVDKKLRPEHREPYTSFIRDPSTTVSAAHAWLLERGYSIGRKAVANHLKRQQLAILEAKSSAELARAFASVVRADGAGVLTDALLSRFEQLLMEQLFRMQLGDDHPPELYDKLARVLTAAAQNRKTVEHLMRDDQRENRLRERIKDRAAKKTGATPREVAIRVREMLGLRIPPTSEPSRRQSPDASSPPNSLLQGGGVV